MSHSDFSLHLPVGGGGGSGVATSRTDRSFVADSDDEDLSSRFFPILPYGFFDGVDVSGWRVKVGEKGSGRVETRVFDHEAQCEVLELSSTPLDPLTVFTPPTQTLTRPATHMTASLGLLTSRGQHQVVDTVTVHGSTGINNAVDLSLTERLHGLDLGSLAAAPSNTGVFGATREVNTRGEVLSLSKNLPGSPVGNRRKSASSLNAASAALAASASASALATAAASRTNIAGNTTNAAAAAAASSSTLRKQTESVAREKKSAVRPTETFMEFPHPTQFIGTHLPIFNMQVKNVQKYFSFEVEVEDTVGKLYRLDIGNAHTVVRLRLDSANLPLALTSGWNKLSLDLADLTKTCFNATFKQAHRVKILASCRLRRVFFSDISYPDFALPSFLRIFSDAFYAAKRAEDAAIEAEAREWAAAQPQQQDEKSDAAPTPSQPAAAGGVVARPSRLRDQLRAELAAARALDASLASSRSMGPVASSQQHHHLAQQQQHQGLNGHAFEQRLIATQEARILARHAQTQASWSRFKSRTAAKLGIDPSQLNMSRSDLFRAKVEERELIEATIPESEKHGAGREENWSGSLRGTGHSYIAVGGMFSGLFTRVEEKTHPTIEIIRRPNQNATTV